MNGHQRIADLRQRGIRPTIVWVNDTAGHRPDPESLALSICVHGDTPEACDFRCLHGVDRVLLESASQARIDRFIPVLMQHAKRVVSTTWQDENTPRIVRITDTGNILSWPN